MEKVFRDPVHNLLGFDRERDRLVLDLIETSEIQRLRYIKLMGVSYIVYPGADHNRFSHSLGAAFLMKRIIERMQGLSRDRRFRLLVEEIQEYREILLAAALLHDIGHFPLSHLLESFTKEHHERWTSRLVAHPKGEVHQILKAQNRRYPRVIQEIIERTFKPSFAVKLISSQLDVDRMDYLLRDSYHTGVGYGKFDLEWLIHSLRILEHEGDWEIAIDREKGLHAVESYVLARYYMYQQVYHHKTSRAAGVMVTQILKRAAELVKDGEVISPSESLCKLLIQPIRLTPEEFLQLDDVVLTYAIKEWSVCSDEILSDLCRRFLERRVFKTVEIEPERYERVKGRLQRIAKHKSFDPRYYLVLDTAVADPYELFWRTDREVSESIYLVDPDLKLQELSEHSELIRAITNRRVARDRLCFPGELRQAIVPLI
ncbi:MAG: hypothetical protein A2Z21_10785 [Candidatus Fraserbacteria bacterium RBG_16_55_9]|uniref:HD/PDEase domain-containing protein n=1 Tax=Fraserbacteria sp. (strain RBG_16_55_9) TaxID=1817864 RepID=A0A1F5V2H2_FRAXR|nr:MAG: hypothetical protein A2Z21_10785 [Candidatus Fraserbacteria bacterium RBG_16_55_9]